MNNIITAYIYPSVDIQTFLITGKNLFDDLALFKMQLIYCWSYFSSKIINNTGYATELKLYGTVTMMWPKHDAVYRGTDC